MFKFASVSSIGSILVNGNNSYRGFFLFHYHLEAILFV